MSDYKPSFHRRSSMTKKEGAGDDDQSKPTLDRRKGGSQMASRSERIVQALENLSNEKLKTLTTRIGADELAVALLDADSQIKSRIADCLEGEQAQLFNQYLAMGKEKLPSSVIDGAQGKLLRLAH